MGWKNGKYFGHTLFGATHFHKYGIEAQIFDDKKGGSWKKIRKIFKFDARIITHTVRLWVTRDKYDLIYAPYPRGLELLIFLRSIGLFKKPIVIFVGYKMISNRKNKIKMFLLKQYCAGIDKILFFTNTDYEDVKMLDVCTPEKLCKVTWGTDLEFYDRVKALNGEGTLEYFISVGKASRDYSTLVDAFNGISAKLKLYVAQKQLEKKYSRVSNNIEIFFLPVTDISPYILVEKLSKAIAVTICLKKTEGQQGISNLYEAMAMGKAVIVTRNRFMDIDVEKEQIGLLVDVGDVEGWKKAINFLQANPEKAAEFGRRGRLLAEKYYNLEMFTEEVSKILKTLNTV